jgi:DNA repair protein RadD
VKCEHIDGMTPKPERDAILQRLGSGDIDVVSNCMVLTEGWDMPDVGCCVLARPTRKMGLYRQMIGRVLRPAPGKPDAIVIDHSGAVHRHGFVEDRVEWTLSPDRYADNPTHASRSKKDFQSRLVDCSQCGALRTGGEPCRHCGYMPVRPPQHLSVIDGDLGLATRGRGVMARCMSPQEMEAWHRQLAYIAAERGYKPGWAAHKHREKFGIWPRSRDVVPEPPKPEVLSWVRSRAIAYAKAAQQAKASA